MSEPDSIPQPLVPRLAWSCRGSFHRNDTRFPEGLPRISVVIPSYNQGRFLEAAIRSVLLQDYPREKVECIVIDGGSKDESVRVMEHYAAWLTYRVSEPDRGQAHAINKGFKHATGDFRSYLNSDDLYAPGCFMAVARAAMQRPEVGVFHGERILLGGDDEVLGWTSQPQFDPAVSGYTVASETAFWRASLAQAGDGFDETLRFAMDLDFFGRLYSGGVRFHKLDRFLGYFRCHADAKSATLQDVCTEESQRLWQKHFKRDAPARESLPKGSRIRLIVGGLRSPRRVLLPYVKTRILRMLHR